VTTGGAAGADRSPMSADRSADHGPGGVLEEADRPAGLSLVVSDLLEAVARAQPRATDTCSAAVDGEAFGQS
jgi:hypothetical protein